VRVATGIALAISALAVSLPAAGAAVSLPARDPVWWSPGASLRAAPVLPGDGPEHAQFDDGLTGWTLTGPGRVDVRAGGPAHHYAAIRDNTTLTSATWTPPSGAQIVTVWARALHQTEALRVGAIVAGRLVVLGTIDPGLSWRRYALPATPIRGRPVALVLDPVMPFAGGIDVAFPGHTETPARGFVFDIGAATRQPGGPDGQELAAEPGSFLLRGGAFTVPRDATTVSLWLHAKAGTAPQIVVQANGLELAQATATTRWTALRLDAAALRGHSVRLRVRSNDASGLQLALIGTVQRAPEIRIVRTSRDPAHRRALRVVLQGPTGLAGQAVRVEIQRTTGTFRIATIVRLDTTGRAVATLAVPLHALALRTSYAGDEAYTAGLSAVHAVKRAPKPPKPAA
jgi:hypothetical protein